MRFGTTLAVVLMVGGVVATASIAKDAVPKTPVTPSASAITGEVTIVERIELKPDASLQVRLLDVLTEAPAVVVAHRIIKPVTALPVSFTLPFNPKRISSSHTYVVDARLVSGYREWHTVAPHPVLTNGAGPTVSIVAE